MLLLRVVHVSSTFEFGAVFHYFLSEDPQVNPPFSPFSEPHKCYCLALFRCPPSSSAKPLVTGKHVILLFSGSVPSPNMCICVCVYMYIMFVVLVVVCILFCAEEKRRSRDESRYHEKGRTDEISVLCLLSFYLR